MALRFTPRSPRGPRFVDPVIRATRWRLANLTPASGRQNHTASPSATASARLTLRCVHRIPPDVHDDREPPLLARRDGESKPQISEKRKQNIFARGVNTPNPVDAAGKINFSRRRPGVSVGRASDATSAALGLIRPSGTTEVSLVPSRGAHATR